jgi:hypothetical protein
MVSVSTGVPPSTQHCDWDFGDFRVVIHSLSYYPIAEAFEIRLRWHDYLYNRSCPGPTRTALEPVSGHTANQGRFGEHRERLGLALNIH